jgi:tRNA-uridine 2-sulfurtransferase
VKRALVCLSGGVDSTVAAHLLLQRGYDVSAVTFWFWSFPGAPDYARQTNCCALDTASLAADELGIPHKVIDASDAFHERVLSDYVERYKRGETPNPCGRCNRYLRFGHALAYARDHGFDLVATGHHVRKVVEPDGTFGLARGADRTKDQTYFLYGLTQTDLARLEFPVGELTKDKVYAIARREGLTAADLPESQDLCFAVAGDTSFLFPESALRPGPILSVDRRPLGYHRGLPRYTIGQRRGLGISTDEPLYVVDIDPERNALIVGSDEALLRPRLVAGEAQFLSGAPPEHGARVETKIRYRSPAVPATYRAISCDRFELDFDRPQRAITPGQLAVLYRRDRLLGGGTIRRSIAPTP